VTAAKSPANAHLPNARRGKLNFMLEVAIAEDCGKFRAVEAVASCTSFL
jgi:hypothetical protein